MRISTLLLFIFLSGSGLIHSQSRIMDSVRVLLNTTKDEQVKLKQLRMMSYYHHMMSNLDSSIYFADLGIALATKLNAKKDLANIYGTLGQVYVDKGKQPKALEIYYKAIRIGEELGDKKTIADNYVRIGALYDEQADYDKSLKNYFTALSAYRKLNNKAHISMVTGNIGNVYYSKKQYGKALELYLEAIKLDEELNNNTNLQYSLGYIGMVTAELAKTDPSKKDSFNTVSITYYKRALDLATRAHNPQLVINWLGNMGIKYAEMKKFKEAESALKRAVMLADSFNLPQEKVQFQNGISELYYSMGDYKRSIDHYKQYTREKDSLYNIEKNQELTKHEMNFEFSKKMEAVRTAQEKKEAEAEARARQQKLIIYFVIAVLLIVAVFAGFIFRQLRITRSQKTIIELQKRQVEEQRHEMLASIHYAKRIQSAHMPSEKYIERKMKELK